MIPAGSARPGPGLAVSGDSPVVFGPPVGRAGRLERLAALDLPDGSLRVALTVSVERGHFATLEAAEAFANRRAARSPNLRGGFDPHAPVSLTLWLAPALAALHFSGAPDAHRAALLALAEDLAAGRRDAAWTAPSAWTFESAVQAVHGQPFALGYHRELARPA